MPYTKEEKAEYMRAYYKAHRDEMRANAKRSYEKHKEARRAEVRYQYRKHKQERRAAIKAYQTANVEKYAETQFCIREARIAAGLSLEEVAEAISRSPKTIRMYEKGTLPAPWDRLEAIIPGLKEASECPSAGKPQSGSQRPCGSLRYETSPRH